MTSRVCVRPAALLLALACSFALPMFSQAQPESMSHYWPNADGRTWVFAQRYQDFVFNPETIDNVVTYAFNGTTTAPVGIEAQLWEATASGSARSTWSSDTVKGGVAIRAPREIEDPFLRNLWLARPDLREKVQARAAGDHPCPTASVPGQLSLFLLGSAAWVKDEFEIAAWRCNADNLRAWVWMTDDLSVGSTFTLQLIPDLATDVFLYGTVGGFEDVTVSAGVFSECLRIDYRVDYGEAICGDSNGDPIGSIRLESVGFNHYAPGVGPVDSFEQFTVVSVMGECIPPGEPGDVWTEITLDLTMSPPVPAHETTWGRLKSAFAK